jgi:hypothetical protein
MEQWPSVSKIKSIHTILFIDTSATHYIKNHQHYRYASVSQGRSKGSRKKDSSLCTKNDCDRFMGKERNHALEYSSFAKSTYRSSHLPASLKTLATSDKNITHPAMINCC